VPVVVEPVVEREPAVRRLVDGDLEVDPRGDAKAASSPSGVIGRSRKSRLSITSPRADSTLIRRPSCSTESSATGRKRCLLRLFT